MPTTKRRMSMEPLESRQMLTTIVMEVEPNNNEFQGTPFELDPADNSAELIGTSVNDDDDDWFRLTAPGDGFLNAQVSSPNGNFAELDVERINGTEILETDPDDGINAACGVVVAGEELFIRMRSEGGSAEYSTRLTFSELRPDGCNAGNTGGDGPVGDPTAFYPEVENNDRRFRATPIELIQDGVVQLQGTSLSEDDEDYFSFVMPADGDVTFEVFSVNGGLADLEIEDVFGTELIETEPEDGINTGTITLRGGDTFFVKMEAEDFGPAEYQVNIGLTAATNPVISTGFGQQGSSLGTSSGTGNDAGLPGFEPIGPGGRIVNNTKQFPSLLTASSTSQRQRVLNAIDKVMEDEASGKEELSFQVSTF